MGTSIRCERLVNGHRLEVPTQYVQYDLGVIESYHRCSAGISSSYDNNEFFAVGGVGYQNWKGRTMFYDSKIGANALQSVSIDGIRSRTYDYFGYSTASCYDKKDKFTYLFVSAPRSKNIRGKVDYIKYYGSVYNGVIQSQFAMGHQIGSYFGASVTCGYTKLSTVQVSPTFCTN